MWRGTKLLHFWGDCSYLVLDHLQYLCYSFVKSALACQPSFLPSFQHYLTWRKPDSRSAIFFLLAQTKFVCWVGIGCTPYIREQIRACMFKAEPRSFLRLLVRPVDWCVLQAKIPVKVNPVSVLSQIWAYGLAVLLTFLVTLGCFPAITVRVSAPHRRVTRTEWIEEGT